MPTQNDSTNEVPSLDPGGFIHAPTGLGAPQSEAEGLHNNVSDPNAAAMNENAEAAKMRQLTGEPPGSVSAQDADGLPPTQSPEFQDGT